MWMKKTTESDDVGAKTRSASGFRALCSLLWKLGLILLLIYGGLQLFVRTDFFRSRAEAELSRLVGMEMRVGRIRATESLNLKLKDVISVSDDAGIEARTVRIRWRLFRPEGVSMVESVRVDGLALTFAPDANGVIQPAFLGRVSQMMLDSAGARLPGGQTPEKKELEKGKKADGKEYPAWMIGPVEIRWASARWQDAKGNLLASASNMELAWVSMGLPNGGQVSHVDCRAGEVKIADGPKISGLHVELIDAGDRQFLVDLDAADWGTAQKPRRAEAEFRELLDAMD